MDNIKIVRLQNGEDLIGDVTFRNDETFDIYEPMVVEIDYRGKYAGLIMHHWLPLQLIKKNEIRLFPKDIIFITEPTDDFAEYYINTVERLHDMLAAKDDLKTMLDDINMDDSDSDDLIEQFDKLTNDSNVLH